MGGRGTLKEKLRNLFQFKDGQVNFKKPSKKKPDTL